MKPHPYFLGSITEAYETNPNRESLVALLREFEKTERNTPNRHFTDFMEIAKRAASFEVSLELEGEVIASEQFQQRCFDFRVSLDSPGNYTLRMSTGRVIWQDTLATQDLFLIDVTTRKTLPVAADTELSAPKYSRYTGLLGNQFMLQLNPGISCAQLKVVASRWFG
ncbi:MAG: hypothetical protein CML13_06925 [Puniceicoccaceae bacterium]|nr:hypothetical protein [Puniceicoccaceae bacterium]|tara:strand:- start:132 stop:632 length:501 start_codon:yes stop_codon:yes gene_type:complete